MIIIQDTIIIKEKAKVEECLLSYGPNIIFIKDFVMIVRIKLDMKQFKSKIITSMLVQK